MFAASILRFAGNGWKPTELVGLSRERSAMLQVFSRSAAFTSTLAGVDPSAPENVMLTGIDVPIRIGDVTVVPGDIAIGDPEGVAFVPTQLGRETRR